MWARPQPGFMTAHFQSHPQPFFSTPLAHNPVVFSHLAVAPGGQSNTKAHPVIVAVDGPFTGYPPQYEIDGEDGGDDENFEEPDERLINTYGSFSEEPILALNADAHRQTWTLVVSVPIPEISNPTLLALDYTIKYATTCDNGNSTIQTDILLTRETVLAGVVSISEISPIGKGDNTIPIYRNNASYSPRMVDHDVALCLSTSLAVKCNGGGEQWSHYIDNQRITPHVRIVEECHLYLVFHVCEYPSPHTARSLSIQVSGTWQKEEVEIKAKTEAEMKAREEAETIAKVERVKRIREAEEKQAREEEREERAKVYAARGEAYTR